MRNSNIYTERERERGEEKGERRKRENEK